MDYMFANDEECSSGCESGWTLYLDHSSISSYDRRNDHSRRRVISRDDEKKLKEEDEEEEEEEGLSMVSDASSGPPHHVHGSEDGNDDALLMSRNRKKNRDKRRRNSIKVQDRDTLLDDTASSPLFNLSNKSSILTTNKTSMENVLEYSQGYSTTQFEHVRPPYQQHCHDFFQSGNQLQQQNHRW